MSKSLEELKSEKAIESFNNYPALLSIHGDKAYLHAFNEGFDAAIKAVSEREKTINEKEMVDIITEWKHFWMNQTQNNQQDYENYFRRASGIDANMKYNLAKRICEALKDYREIKNGKI